MARQVAGVMKQPGSQTVLDNAPLSGIRIHPCPDAGGANALCRVLLIEDNPGDARLVREQLNEAGGGRFQLQCCARLAEGLARLAAAGGDLLLLDLHLPDAAGFETFTRAKAAAGSTPIVLLTGMSDETLAAEAVKAGAQDYLVKGEFDGKLLVRALDYAIERHRTLAALAASEARFRLVSDHNLDGVLVLDAERAIHFANPAAVQLLAHGGAALAGQLFPFPLTPAQAVDLEIAWHDRVVEMRMAPMEWQGQPMYLATLHDITARKRAEAELNQRNRELETLLRVSQTLHSQHDFAAAVETVVQAACDTVPRAEASSIWLYDPERDDLYLRAWVGFKAEAVRGLRLPRDNSAAGLVLRTNELLSMPDTTSDPRFIRLGLEIDEIRASVIAPIRDEGATIGVLCVDNFSATHVFSAADRRLMRGLATQVSIALQGARLFDQVRGYASGLEERIEERTAALKQLAQALAAERDRTRSILDALGEAVLVAGADARVVYANPAFEHLTGLALSEVVGQDWLAHLNGHLKPGDRRRMLVAMRDGKAWRGELVNTRRDGSCYEMALTVTPLIEGERVRGSIAVERDITPLKEAERLKDQFIANVSHELRNPLAVLSLVSGNLERYYERLSEEERRTMIQDIRRQSALLGDLISDILQFARLETGGLSEAREWLDLVTLCREVLQEQTPLAHDQGLNLLLEGESTLWLQGNDGHLRQVVRNLLNNAIKYSRRVGQVSCEVRLLQVGCEAGPGWPGSDRLPGPRCAAIAVRDQGIGIHPDDLPHLFDRFFRGQVESAITGTGLGLPITRSLVEMHGGAIHVASVLGEGSTFAAYLPLHED